MRGSLHKLPNKLNFPGESTSVFRIPTCLILIRRIFTIGDSMQVATPITFA